MSNAETCLSHTKSGHLKRKKNGSRALSPAFLKNGRRAFTLDILKKIAGFLTETLWQAWKHYFHLILK